MTGPDASEGREPAISEGEVGGIVMLTTPMLIELAALSGGAENGVLVITQPVLSPSRGVEPVNVTRKSSQRLEEFAVTSLGTSQRLEASRV